MKKIHNQEIIYQKTRFIMISDGVARRYRRHKTDYDHKSRMSAKHRGLLTFCKVFTWFCFRQFLTSVKSTVTFPLHPFGLVKGP